MYSVRVTSEPTSEPVSLADAKLHLRVTGTEEDTLIAGLIRAARERAERYTGRVFLTQTLRLGLDYFPTRSDIYLPGGQLQSVSSIQYIDINGTLQTLSTSIYDVDSWSEPARISRAWSVYWPIIRPVNNAIQIAYTAGWTTEAAVPSAIKSAMLLLIGSLYEQREDLVVGARIVKSERAAEDLLESWRIGDDFTRYSREEDYHFLRVKDTY